VSVFVSFLSGTTSSSVTHIYSLMSWRQRFRFNGWFWWFKFIGAVWVWSLCTNSLGGFLTQTWFGMILRWVMGEFATWRLLTHSQIMRGLIVFFASKLRVITKGLNCHHTTIRFGFYLITYCWLRVIYHWDLTLVLQFSFKLSIFNY